MKPTALLPLALIPAALLGAARPASAESAERDPMQPPALARAPLPAASAASPAASAPAQWRPRYLIASGGKRWLVQDARRYGVGDTFGSARIERIDDDAVWLREAGAVTRVPLFGSVAKRPAGTTPTTQQPQAVRKERQP